VELRHLRYFAAVAADLNFTKAARKLRVAQPALSRQIHQLEEEIGVALFLRDRGRVSLTEPGRAFLAEALNILRQSEQAIQSAQALGRARGGELRIGYVLGLFHTIAPLALARFRAQNAGIASHLFDLSAADQAKELLEGRLDAGFIGFAEEADAAGLAKRKIGVCRFDLALPSGHPAISRKSVPLATLANELFILISEDAYPGASEHALAACRKAGFRPKSLQSAERGHTILGLVAARCGIALLPSPLRALPHPGVVFRRLAEPVATDLQVAWNVRRISPLLELFLKSLGESARLSE
jgi:DNA-binding transcriptional LysR family regulator